MDVTVGAGAAGIAGVGRGSGNGTRFNIPGMLQSPVVWGWIIYGLCWAWLIGLFAAMGGYKGDVAS